MTGTEAPLTSERALEFVHQANADPATVRALLQPRLAIATIPFDEPHAIAAWALGLALRNLRELDSAQQCLTAALAHLTIATDHHTGAGLSLVGALAHQGEFDEALEILDGLRPSPELQARTVFQRAAIDEFRGELGEAHAGYEAAWQSFRTSGDRLGEAHALSGRGLIECHRGHAVQAITTFGLARALYDEIELPLLVTVADYNIGFAATEAGELAIALNHLARAHEAMKAFDEPFGELALVHVYALSAAGLMSEAADLALDSLDSIEDSGAEGDRSEMLLALGRSLRDAGNRDAADQVMATARDLFDRQGRELWVAAAEIALLESTAAAVVSDAELHRIRGVFAVHDSHRVVDVDLLAARLAVERSNNADLLALAEVANERRHDARDSLIIALHQARGGRHGRVISEVETQLQLDLTATSTLGLDIRAALAGSRNELLDLGLAAAIESDDASAFIRLVLLARRRIFASTTGAAVAPQVLDALRSPTAASTWLDLANRVRNPSGSLPRTPSASLEYLTLEELAPLTVFVATSATYACAELSGGQARFHPLPDREVLFSVADRHRRVLQQLLQGRVSAETHVDRTAAEFRDLVPQLSANTQTLRVMTLGRFDRLPWTSLAERPLRLIVDDKRGAHPSTGSRVVAVAGPDLQSSEEELAALSRVYGRLAALEGGGSTPRAVADLLQGAAVAHLCCHGESVLDAPLLSHLDLSGGRLTGYEIERFVDPPAVVMAAACRAGALAAVDPGSTALGVATAWLAAGSSTVIAPSCRIPDTSDTVSAVTRIHQAMRDGHSAEVAVRRTIEADTSMIARSFDILGRSGQ